TIVGGPGGVPGSPPTQSAPAGGSSNFVGGPGGIPGSPPPVTITGDVRHGAQAGALDRVSPTEQTMNLSVVNAASATIGSAEDAAQHRGDGSGQHSDALRIVTGNLTN